MPELPEVEITRLRIAPLLVGRTILRVRTSEPSYFFVTPTSVLKRRLKARTVLELTRIGKYLLAQLDDRSRLLLHLGMTGQLFSSEVTSLRLLSAARRSSLAPEQQRSFQPDVHTHLEFWFADAGPRVYFRDVRKFGKCALLRAGDREPRLEKLGVDALSARGEDLYAATRRRRIAVKSLLLDQTVLAGVGNIYADEALHMARVAPTRNANTLSAREAERIVQALQKVMLRSIETGGSSISDYVQPDGSDGAYQDERLVYARTGEPCPTCAKSITRIVLGQRSTHFCARCQR